MAGSEGVGWCFPATGGVVEAEKRVEVGGVFPPRLPENLSDKKILRRFFPAESVVSIFC